MIIDLKNISTSIRNFSFSLEKNWWNSNVQDDVILGLSSPVKVSVDIYRAGDRYVVEGDLSVTVDASCDRCLEPYNIDLSNNFKVFLAPPPPENEKDEIELLEEDMDVGFITGEQLNVDEVIREQIYLSLPAKFLCREDCSGLCPDCGTNLNKGDCDCRKAKGHPAFSKLKNLKLEGE
jgi:uncharacterized protein